MSPGLNEIMTMTSNPEKGSH